LAEMNFERVEPAATGRPSYHPSVLLKLYIYGYLNRVQSSRRLEREAGRNVEVMWLLGWLAPDHKTDRGIPLGQRPGLRKVCARFVELCREMGLLATASVAIDGSEFQQPGQELYTSEGGAAASPAGGERCAISEPA
jgi:transposase